MKQDIWTFVLTRDEMVALARAIDDHIERLKRQENSDEKATIYVNLCRVIAKFPDEEWFDRGQV